MYPLPGARNISCQFLSEVFCMGLEYVPTRDGSGTNPSGDVLTKKSYWVCVKPEKGVEYPDIFLSRASAYCTGTAL